MDDRPGVDSVGVGVGGIIVDDARRVLLAERGPEARNRHGQWENPGGSLGFGEEFEDAIRREIREELDIEVAVEGLLRFVNHIFRDGEPGEESMHHWVSATFVCRHTGGVPKIVEVGKCSAIDWFDLDRLPAPMAEISADDLDCYRRLTRDGGSLMPAGRCGADSAERASRHE